MLSERLIDLRKLNKFTQAEVAFKLRIARTTYNGYEKGIILPPPDKIIKLANMYGVSTDYLLGTNESKFSKLDLEKELTNLITKLNNCDDVYYDNNKLDDNELLFIENKLLQIAALCRTLK